MTAIVQAAKAAVKAQEETFVAEATKKVATLLGANTLPKGIEVVHTDVSNRVLVVSDTAVALAVRDDGIWLVEDTGEGNWGNPKGPIEDLTELGRMV